jgi:hypothetical protein
MWTELLIAIVASVLIIGIYWVIRGFPPGVATYQMPPVTPNGIDTGQAKFMFFYTPWCPHCKTAQPVWASLKETLKNTPSTFGGHSIIFEEINCDSDKGKSALYKIEGYPTFKLETDSKLYDFKGRPSVAGLETFLTQILGQKKAA